MVHLFSSLVPAAAAVLLLAACFTTPTLGQDGTLLAANPNLQYHIQTDQGSDRFFRFQTLSGQYRKEQRHPDGSVTGSYGWVDPNGVLRLYDYVSDSGGYRIERTRLFKVGKHVAGGHLVETRGGPLDLGFEVFPLDASADPAFNGAAAARRGGVPVIGKSGFRGVNGPEGELHLTPSYQVHSLTSTRDRERNPVSKQGQATAYEAEPVLAYPIRAVPAPPLPKPEPIVIGFRRNDPPKPAPRRPIVIGHTANEPAAPRRRPAPRPVARASRPTAAPRKNTVVIGVSYDNQ